MVDYNYIYGVYISLYKFPLATNLQLQCNSLILWCDILFIISLYFHGTIVT